MSTITTRALRGPVAVAFAAVGILGLAACSGGDASDESAEPTTSASSGAEESTEPTTSEAPEETEAAAGGELCTNEQLSSLTAASGQTIPDEAFAAATAEFQPASAVGDLPTECVLTLEEAGQFASFAFLPGGAATLATVAEQANAAGGSVQDVGGVITGTLDGATISGVPLTQIAPDSTAFENPADIVVLTGIPSVG